MQHQQQQQATSTQLAFLQSQGFPAGLIEAVSQAKRLFPRRIWILDNGSFMNVRDAHVLTPDYQQVNNVTRWEELLDSLSYHCDFYTHFSMPTRFALLNKPPVTAAGAIPQYFTLMETGNLAQEEQIVGQVLSSLQPSGPAPLATELNILYEYVASIDADLRAHGQTVSIVIATQGVPTNEKGESSPQIFEEFVQALRRLGSLSVSITVRLCSDDEKTFNFFNFLDSQDNFDVLDDFYKEALEVYLRNPWLCYALVLHRFRETGFRTGSTLDRLDERALSLPELREFCQLLFGVLLPDPAVDWNGFRNALQTHITRERPHWNPILKTITPWINLELLNTIYTRIQPHGQAQQLPPAPPVSSNTVPPPMGATAPRPQAPSWSSAAGGTVPGQQSPATATSPPMSLPNDLTKAVERFWSKEPPNFTQNKGIVELLRTIHLTFALVEPHVYFSKFHAFSPDALTGSDIDVLKRAVRKTRLFLHPDKLPNDFTEQQQALCRVLWETTSEAWNLKEQQLGK